jgi:lipoprotein-anchoring transpeptidase ErfK/SrfK
MQIVKLTAILITGTIQVFAQDTSRRLVISIQDRKLALIEDGRAVRIYSVAVGKPSTPSPAGSFSIVTRIPNPTWYTRGQVVAPGPANPLGTRWIGLSQKGYGIHGTNNQSSVGQAASHGCIRMRKADIEELFKLVKVGDTVELLDELPPDIAAFFTTALAATRTNAGGAE